MSTTSRPRWLVGLGALVLVVALLLAGREAALDRVVDLVELARGWGAWGRVLYGMIYVAACVLALPASVLTLAAGLLWGPWGAVAVVWPAATAGALASFVLGRTVLRAEVARRLEDWPVAAAVDRALQGDGLRVVTLLRLSPLFPFNLLNYLLGATSVSARDYALGTAVGILPGTALYATLGSTVADVASLVDGRPDAGSGGLALTGLGLVATAAVTAWITRQARRALRDRLDGVG